jgi:hypothetical protein
MQRDLIAACTRIAAASPSAIGRGIADVERRTIDQICMKISQQSTASGRQSTIVEQRSTVDC